MPHEGSSPNGREPQDAKAGVFNEPQFGAPVRITVSVMPELPVMAGQREFQRAIENLL